MKKSFLMLAMLACLAMLPVVGMATEAANRDAYPNFVPVGRSCDLNAVKWPTACRTEPSPPSNTPSLKQASFFERFRAYLAAFRNVAF